MPSITHPLKAVTNQQVQVCIPIKRTQIQPRSCTKETEAAKRTKQDAPVVAVALQQKTQIFQLQLLH